MHPLVGQALLTEYEDVLGRKSLFENRGQRVGESTRIVTYNHSHCRELNCSFPGYES